MDILEPIRINPSPNGHSKLCEMDTMERIRILSSLYRRYEEATRSLSEDIDEIRFLILKADQFNLVTKESLRRGIYAKSYSLAHLSGLINDLESQQKIKKL